MSHLPRLPLSVMTVLGTGALTSVGGSIVSLGVIWLLTGLSHSALDLGLYFMVIELPYLALLVPAGVWADRANRRLLSLSVLAVRVLATLGIAYLARLHHVGWFTIALAVVAQEAASAVLQPAYNAWLFGIVPPEQFGALSGWQQAANNASNLLGPTLGGILVSILGIPGAIGAGAVAAVPQWFGIALAGRSERRRPPEAAEAGAGPGFASGWQFLREHSGILATVLFFSATNGLNNVEAVLVPLLARTVLHLPAWQFGLLSTAFGVGGLTGAWLGVRLDAARPGRLGWAFAAMVVFALAIVAMGSAADGAELGLAYLALGISFTVAEVVTGALWQRMVPDDLRGRVFSTLGTLARSANPLGFLLAGWLGAFLGVREGLWVGGGAILLLTIAVSSLGSVRALTASLVAGGTTG